VRGAPAVLLALVLGGCALGPAAAPRSAAPSAATATTMTTRSTTPTASIAAEAQRTHEVPTPAPRPAVSGGWHSPAEAVQVMSDTTWPTGPSPVWIGVTSARVVSLAVHPGTGKTSTVSSGRSVGKNTSSPTVLASSRSLGTRKVSSMSDDPAGSVSGCTVTCAHTGEASSRVAATVVATTTATTKGRDERRKKRWGLDDVRCSGGAKDAAPATRRITSGAEPGSR